MAQSSRFVRQEASGPERKALRETRQIRALINRNGIVAGAAGEKNL
jgi:hypothetical protein